MPVSPSFYSDGVPPDIPGLAEQAARNTGGAYRYRGRQSWHNQYQGSPPDDRRCGDRVFTSSSRSRFEGLRLPDRLVSQDYSITNGGNQHHYTHHRHSGEAGNQKATGNKRPASVTPPVVKMAKYFSSDKADARAGVKQATTSLSKPTTTQSSITITKLSAPQLSNSTKRRLRRERAQVAVNQQQQQPTSQDDEPIVTKIVVASISQQGNDTDEASSDDEISPDQQPELLVVRMTSMTVHDGDVSDNAITKESGEAETASAIKPPPRKTCCFSFVM
ncbi:unnamed protein product [Didymodactylos carnosus]|nr:unnamed protein product [Didymodactylos carnosus]CAF4349548.1 unnamed protein product [Didymodactylos carnosus]